MSSSGKSVDPAFQGAGQRTGIEIWRIENFQPVPLPKSEHGKFYMGDSYIVLQTTGGKGGGFLYDIHFWIGKDTSQDEAGTAAIKTVELDASLGGRAVQHRELQGHESDKFLSYFKPCIIPLEGGVASGFKKPVQDKFETKLYVCRGKRAVRLKQVPFSRSSLNHDDVFILDTEDKIYQFNGANSNIQERAKALEVIQYFKDEHHEGKCDVAIIDDGKLVAESDSGEFWVLFGGFAPIGRKITSEDDITLETTPGVLYSIVDCQTSVMEGPLSKVMLENNKCYLLDCGAEVFVWVGRVTQVEDRKNASQVAQEFISNQNRPKSTRITHVIQGFETYSFKSNFQSWPAGTGTSGADDGRGKVAALLKQQGVEVKGASKVAPSVEEIPPLLEGGGKLEVWHINGSAKTQLPKEEIGKFYGGDCYIILYTYHSSERKEDYFLACWIGKDSVPEDQTVATRLSNTMFTSLKGRPVQGRIFQGKEPPQFVALFQPMVVLKGGISTGYKKFIADKGLTDETYTFDSVALIQISSATLHNNVAVQVDAVATSLSSSDCFLLQSGASIFSWHGTNSSFEQQQLTAKIAEFLKPGVIPKHSKEGTENSSFWSALGGKQSYTSKKPAQEITRDPHLYIFSNYKGKFEIVEVFNFSQDDLLPEDILILDTHTEVFVWVGHSVDPKEKQNAFEIGQRYIELATALEGLLPDVPLYKVTEGNEPCFFTTYFSWDTSKAIAQGNSFEKKMSLLFGSATNSSETQSRSNNSNEGATQRQDALRRLQDAFNSTGTSKTAAPKVQASNEGSQRKAALLSLTEVLTAEQAQKKKGSLGGSPMQFRKSSASSISGEAKSRTPSETDETPEVKEIVEPSGSGSEVQEEPQSDENGNQSTFNYEQLKSKSVKPATGIDYKRREAYLSNAEFKTVLGMTKEAFYKQPKWKQDLQKKKVDLF